MYSFLCCISFGWTTLSYDEISINSKTFRYLSRLYCGHCLKVVGILEILLYRETVGTAKRKCPGPDWNYVSSLHHPCTSQDAPKIDFRCAAVIKLEHKHNARLSHQFIFFFWLKKPITTEVLEFIFLLTIFAVVISLINTKRYS